MRFAGWWAGAVLLWTGLATPCQALDSAMRLQDYNHAIWTARDGLPSGINTIAQTPDGWMWLGTSSGLFRFDGVRFQRYDGASKLLTTQIGELSAEDNGDLWIGYNYGGASVLHADGRLEHFPGDSMLGANSLVADRDGSVWIGAGSGVFHLSGGIWKKIGPEDGLSSAPDGRFLRDQYDRLWLTADDQLYRYDRAHRRFVAQGPKKTDRIFQVSPDGRVWTGAAGELRPLPPDPGTPPLPRAPRFNQRSGRGYGLFDRDGNFWTDFCGPAPALCRVARAGALQGKLLPAEMATDRLDQSWQLSSLLTRLVFEDSEANVWLLTNLGLERFRENRIRALSPPRWWGNFGMARDPAGRIWASDYSVVMAWPLPLAGEEDILRSQRYSSVANAGNGDLLLAGPRAIERRGRNGSTLTPLPPAPHGPLADHTTFFMLDDGRTLWAGIGDGIGRRGLVDGQWHQAQSYGALPIDATLHFNVGGSRVLAARPGGHVLVYEAQRLVARYEPDVGDISGLYDDGREMLVGGEDGLALLEKGRFRRLPSDAPAVFANISGMVVTADGDHWFNGGKGLIRVAHADWADTLEHPSWPLRYTLFDALDGYQGGAARGNPSLYQAVDGRLWYASTAGIGRIDPRHLARNMVAPQVFVTAIDGRAPSPVQASPLRLAPGASHFTIDFTAASLSKPERVRFHYQLIGVDAGWQDAGTRRGASYTNVGPGAYRFRVAATNEDGVASERETEVAFEVPPTTTQTWWFRTLVAAAALALLYGLYRYRLRRATLAAVGRLNARVAERESIARDLHDTLLQSVQGVILNVHALSMDVSAQEPLRQAMENTVRQANEVLAEGRDRVRDLRDENSSPQALVDALRRVGAAHAGQTRFAFDCAGELRPLHPVVQDEALAIGRECLLNAFRHAGAASVSARLVFGERELRLDVVDDGRGIPAEVVAARGRTGHWGLASLYERAHKIGAQLALNTSSDSGTAWRMTVPAALAYRLPREKATRR